MGLAEAFLKVKIDVGRFRAVMNQLALGLMNEPVPPLPRRYYQGTAREYRAARRRYRRQLDVRKKR